MMKKLTYLILLLLSVVFSACEEGEEHKEPVDKSYRFSLKNATNQKIAIKYEGREVDPSGITLRDRKAWLDTLDIGEEVVMSRGAFPPTVIATIMKRVPPPLDMVRNGNRLYQDTIRVRFLTADVCHTHYFEVNAPNVSKKDILYLPSYTPVEINNATVNMIYTFTDEDIQQASKCE